MMSGIICCVCSILAISVLQFVLKRWQKDSGEERVTAKSRPMMSLIARVPSNVSSSTSVSPGKRSYENQNLWSAKAEREARPGQPVVGSDQRTKWKKSMAGGGNKKRYQYCTDSSGYLRVLQGHSGSKIIDPTLQDNVIIQSNFFQYIYHVGCAINLHSIISSGLVPGGQNLNNRTVFFLPVDSRDKSHKDPDAIDLSKPRHAQYMHKAWKRHQDAVFWVDINLAIRKGLKFYQTRSNAIILHETLPAYCTPKVVRMETGEVIYEKVYMSPRPPPKISLRHDWKRELGSEHAQRPEGQAVQQSRSFQSNQPKPKS